MSAALRRTAVPFVLMTAGVLSYSCSSSTGPDAEPVDRLVFSPEFMELGEEREGIGLVLNNGDRPVGPIGLVPGATTDVDGKTVSGVQILVTPAEIPSLRIGATAQFSVSVSVPASLEPGRYGSTIDARLDGRSLATMGVLFTVAAPAPSGLSDSIAITGGPASVRQGDVVAFTAETRDSTGALVNDPTLAWSVLPASAGHLEPDGRFVGFTPGTAQIIARASAVADTLDITIAARGVATGGFSVVGQGPVTSRFTSDLWVHGNYAYMGTWNCRGSACGDRLLTWDVTDPSSPTLSDEMIIDARTVNDVKVRDDGAIAVITHELSNDGMNGVTLLDLADPARPAVITRFTAGLEPGVHNVWIDGDYVYVAVNGAGNGLRVLDITNASSPSVVASFYADSSFLHDIYVRDGLAFLSHWNAGLVILDVGNGIAGGSPTNPKEAGRVATAGGETHNAWYWPATGYVFVGEEDLGTPGIMHVVDASDLANPREVASFKVPGTTPHNFWLDEDREILYLAWYENGVRALDMSGALLADLDLQGREIAFSQYGTGSGCFGGSATCSWAPQLHGGLLYVSDLNTGLWILQPTF